VEAVSNTSTVTLRVVRGDEKGSLKSTNKQTPWLESASELYRPTERPPLVGEVSANFSGKRVSCGQRNDSRTVVNFGFLNRSRYFLEIAPQLSSRD
jgi:hypothetical protein